jgi:sugar lactone lactonase YvrE
LNKQSILAITAISLLALPFLSANAGEKPFPHKVTSLFGSLPEGFAIGKGSTAYDGSIDGSIYKVNLRNEVGVILVYPEDDFDITTDCFKLGMRVDRRTNNLFVAGCINGNAYVFDADNGTLKMEYQLGPDGEFALPNDLTITNDAVYFTDSYLPLIYGLPLANNGGIPDSSDDITEILLPDEFILDPENDPCCGANGIVSTPDGKILIVGHSNRTELYRVDPATSEVGEILLDPPLRGDTPDNSFIDGLVLHNRTLYVLNPHFDGTPDEIQVVKLDNDMRTGGLVGIITDPDLDGVASGALFGNSLYVNGARYFSDLVSEKWITKLNRHAVEPGE